MTLYHTLALRLSELMKDCDNISADQLGREIGCGGSTIRAWRLGNKLPSLSNSIKLADYFGCSLDYLFGRIDIDFSFKIMPLLPIYERVSQLLIDNKVSWYKVHKITKIARGTLDCWKQGKEPLLSTLDVLAKYFDCSIDYLIGRDR